MRKTLAFCEANRYTRGKDIYPLFHFQDDESYNHLQAPQRDLWLDLLEEVSSDETIVGASRHLLYVGRKDGEFRQR